MEVSRKKYPIGRRVHSYNNPKRIIQRERDINLNFQKRQKFAERLVEQLIKKLKAEKYRNIVQNEVYQLIRKEVINDKDLKQLEKKIINKINQKIISNNLKYKLINRPQLKNKQQRNLYINNNNIYKEEFLECANDKGFYNERDGYIEMVEDAIANEIKKENERKAYFNRFGRDQDIFCQQYIENIIKHRCEQLKEEEERMKRCMYEKERLPLCNEIQFIDNNKLINQKMLRDYYDKQLLEKKEREELEKEIDKAQAEIWKKDSEAFLENEKKIKKIMRDYEIKNVKALDKQVKMGKYNIDKMNEFEKEYNYEIFQKLQEMKKRKCCWY